LNTLSGNRPHQGYVLRCGTYEFETLTEIPNYKNHNDYPDDNSNNVWLVLDEVVDPQNLGALIRTAYFLGGINMLVCSKNSAPPSATVSAASAGALELATIYSTPNLPRTLSLAEQDGYRIIGASADGAENDDIPIYDLQSLPMPGDDTNNNPTLLVLGSEGRGLRHLVAKSCTEFVRIPGGNNNNDGGVDSLNVSVTGGVLLWHMSQQQRTINR
jgi:21S rRNA (GM2251-2'-O)-methyltransferase